jgi:hypothetical protein
MCGIKKIFQVLISFEKKIHGKNLNFYENPNEKNPQKISSKSQRSNE